MISSLALVMPVEERAVGKPLASHITRVDTAGILSLGRSVSHTEPVMLLITDNTTHTGTYIVDSGKDYQLSSSLIQITENNDYTIQTCTDTLIKLYQIH